MKNLRNNTAAALFLISIIMMLGSLIALVATSYMAGDIQAFLLFTIALGVFLFVLAAVIAK